MFTNCVSLSVVVFFFFKQKTSYEISDCLVGLEIFFFQAEDGIRDRSPSRGLGDVYKRQNLYGSDGWKAFRARLLGAIGRFALFSLLAGGLAAVLLIPEIAALHATEFSKFNFPEKINWYFSFFDVIARHATGVSRETGLDHWPNIFCSSAVFFLIPLYIVNRKIPLKESSADWYYAPFSSSASRSIP